jgi:cytochrome c-type biogenesis protein CcmH/NrfG
MVFFVAGMIFGCVLGYMAANAGTSAERPVMPELVATASVGAARTPPANAGVLDPNELKALESLAASDPQNAQARVELGNLLMDHQRWEEAIRWYREALTLKPNDNNVRVDMGACLVGAGKAGEGLAEFDSALKRDPTHAKALYNKGVALMETGRTQEAIAAWEELLKQHPNDPQLAGLRQQIDKLKTSGKPS